jgi:hypothetical protein
MARLADRGGRSFCMTRAQSIPKIMIYAAVLERDYAAADVQQAAMTSEFR